MNTQQSNNNVQNLVDRLQDIQQEMVDLLDEARSLLKGSDYQEIFSHADTTWVKQIKTALHNEDVYPDEAGTTFAETIDEIQEDVEADY